LESELYSYLSGLHTASVYNSQAPQGGAYPVIVFVRISTNPLATNMEGGGNLTQYRYQVDHYAETMAAAQALADITQVLHGRRGLIDTLTCVSFLDNERQEYIASIDMYVVSTDYMITSIQ
jgi:hypothetical protein